MTSRERILRGMRGEPAGRVPTSPRMWKFIRSYYGWRLLASALDHPMLREYREPRAIHAHSDKATGT